VEISCDESKREKVLKERGIDFRELEELLCSPYVEDQKNDDPEQYRIVGCIGDRFLTFIVEYDEDDEGLYQAHPWVLGVRKDGSAFGVLAETTHCCEIRRVSMSRFSSSQRRVSASIFWGSCDWNTAMLFQMSA